MTETGKQGENRPKFRRKLLPALAGILLLAAAACVLGSGVKAEKAGAVRKTVEDVVTEEGVISSGPQVTVLSEVSGPVKEILASENDKVKAGAVLYRIDSVQYDYEKEAAESAIRALEAQKDRARIGQVMTTSPKEYLDGLEKELSSARAAFQAAKSTYEGFQVLAAGGDVSRVDLEQAEAQYRSAESACRQAEERYRESRELMEELQKQGIDSASLNDTFFDSEMGMLDAELAGNRAKLAQLEDRIARCEVRAEQDGIITSLPIREVSAVMEGMETVVLRPLDAGFAEADVLTSVAPWLTVGGRAEIRFGRKGSDTSVFGTISEIYDFASPGVSALGLAEYRVHVKIVPDDPAELAGKEGYGVTVYLPVYRGEDVLTVPAEAVFTEDGRHYVYRVSGGRARKTEVESEYQTGQDAVINAGLSENDTVIARADTEGVHDGVRVR